MAETTPVTASLDESRRASLRAIAEAGSAGEELAQNRRRQLTQERRRALAGMQGPAGTIARESELAFQQRAANVGAEQQRFGQDIAASRADTERFFQEFGASLPAVEQFTQAELANVRNQALQAERDRQLQLDLQQQRLEAEREARQFQREQMAFQRQQLQFQREQMAAQRAEAARAQAQQEEQERIARERALTQEEVFDKTGFGRFLESLPVVGRQLRGKLDRTGQFPITASDGTKTSIDAKVSTAVGAIQSGADPQQVAAALHADLASSPLAASIAIARLEPFLPGAQEAARRIVTEGISLGRTDIGFEGLRVAPGNVASPTPRVARSVTTRGAR